MTTETLFDRFGGTRKMASALGRAPSTINSWKAVGRIPATEQPEVFRKAEELGIEIDPLDILFPLGRPESSSADASQAAA